MTHPLIRPGKIVLLTGYPAGGKTTQALLATTELEEDQCALYFDSCNQFNPHFAEHLGVPVTDEDRFLVVQSDEIGTAVEVVDAAIKSGIDLVILDMINNLHDPEDETVSPIDLEDEADRILRERELEALVERESSSQEVLEGDPEESVDTEEDMEVVELPEDLDLTPLAEQWRTHLEGFQEALRGSQTTLLAVWNLSHKFSNVGGAYVPWAEAADGVVYAEKL